MWFNLMRDGRCLSCAYHPNGCQYWLYDGKVSDIYGNTVYALIERGIIIRHGKPYYDPDATFTLRKDFQ